MVKADETLRARNMRKRRERLLLEARGLLAEGGYEALNLRELARRSEVTVPTIYNLIGRKEAVFLALADDVLTEIEARTAPSGDAGPVEQTEAVVIESLGLFIEDADFYRAAFLAVEWLDQGGQHHAEVARIYAWIDRLISTGIEACVAAGLLRGRIPSANLAAQATRHFRMNCRGWAFGHYGIDEFRRLALGDLYVTLCADAVETFHQQLLNRITKLTQGSVDPDTARHTRTR